MFTSKKEHDGFAVAIAWPETYCRQAGSWYDFLLNGLRISKNGYHKVGHSAVVLIDAQGNCYYYDFGRYTSPYGMGRVRGSVTDHDLALQTKITVDSKNCITNFKELLLELQNKQACHGDGKIHASYCPINFDSANALAIKLNNEPYIPYGPFTYKGTNCSRFTRSIIIAGNPSTKNKFKLHFVTPFTPTPLNNVHNIGKKKIVKKLLSTPDFDPLSFDKNLLKKTQPIPKKTKNIPSSAQWLSGIGSGSWFHIQVLDDASKKNAYVVWQYSADGELESKGEFETTSPKIIAMNEVKITYPSHCARVTLKVGKEKIFLKRKSPK